MRGINYLCDLQCHIGRGVGVVQQPGPTVVSGWTGKFICAVYK